LRGRARPRNPLISNRPEPRKRVGERPLLRLSPKGDSKTVQHVARAPRRSLKRIQPNLGAAASACLPDKAIAIRRRYDLYATQKLGCETDKKRLSLQCETLKGLQQQACPGAPGPDQDSD
jgi:hypothetical protein